jgi:hypothetical protein
MVSKKLARRNHRGGGETNGKPLGKGPGIRPRLSAIRKPIKKTPPTVAQGLRRRRISRKKIVKNVGKKVILKKKKMKGGVDPVTEDLLKSALADWLKKQPMYEEKSGELLKEFDRYSVPGYFIITGDVNKLSVRVNQQGKCVIIAPGKAIPGEDKVVNSPLTDVIVSIIKNTIKEGPRQTVEWSEKFLIKSFTLTLLETPTGLNGPAGKARPFLKTDQKSEEKLEEALKLYDNPTPVSDSRREATKAAEAKAAALATKVAALATKTAAILAAVRSDATAKAAAAAEAAEKEARTEAAAAAAAAEASKKEQEIADDAAKAKAATALAAALNSQAETMARVVVEYNVFDGEDINDLFEDGIPDGIPKDPVQFILLDEDRLKKIFPQNDEIIKQILDKIKELKDLTFSSEDKNSEHKWVDPSSTYESIGSLRQQVLDRRKEEEAEVLTTEPENPLEKKALQRKLQRKKQQIEAQQAACNAIKKFGGGRRTRKNYRGGSSEQSIGKRGITRRNKPIKYKNKSEAIYNSTKQNLKSIKNNSPKSIERQTSVTAHGLRRRKRSKK